MKMGDEIQRIRLVEAGECIFGNLEDEVSARSRFPEVLALYGLDAGTPLLVMDDPSNPGKLGISAAEAFEIGKKAVVNWVVDEEAGITYSDGGSEIIGVGDVGWVVTKSAAPKYQTSVENMTDEELRESIDMLRSNRILRPKVKIKKGRVVSEPRMSKEDKALESVLKGMSDEEKLALKKKLGLV